MKRAATTALSLLAFIAAGVTAAPVEELLTQLPTCDNFTVPAYSGYLNVTSTKALHYIFVES